MSPLYDCDIDAKRVRGIGAAGRALAAGALVVMPTDTVYGLAADAFSAEAVAALLAAKGRGRDMPVPVLVGAVETLAGVAITNASTQALVRAFWPGGLTVVCRQQPSLRWDLGDTRGTVAVRMPDDDIALEVLKATGPLAVSSANISGQPPAATAREARDQLGDAVRVYLERGPITSGGVASTIVDVTGDKPRVLRQGAIGLEQLRVVVPDILDVDGNGPAEAPDDDTASDDTAPEDTVADDSASDDSASADTASDDPQREVDA